MNRKNIIIVAICLVTLLLLSTLFMQIQTQTLSNEDGSSPSTVEALPESSLEAQSFPSENESSPEIGQTASSSPQSGEGNQLPVGFGHIGEEYRLHSRYYQQGEARLEDAPNLGWDGDLLLTVHSARLLEYSVQEDGDRVASVWANSYAAIFSEPKILRLEITLKNENAEHKTGVRYQFNASMFRLAAYEDLIPDNWQDAENYIPVSDRYTAPESQFSLHSDTDDYWSFQLEPGESVDFTLSFLIDAAYLEQDEPFLAISPSRQIQYGVALDRIMEGDNGNE